MGGKQQGSRGSPVPLSILQKHCMGMQEVPVVCTGGKQQGCPAGKQGGGSIRTRHVPLMLRLGFGALPDLRLAQTEVQRVQLHESYLRLRQQQGASSLKASSWR